MNEKKKWKFNLLDALILLVILAVAAFAVYKLIPTENKTPTEKAWISVTGPEVPAEVADAIYIGAPLLDVDRNVQLGKITDVIVEDFVIYGSDADGVMHENSKDSLKVITVVAELNVVPSAYGATVAGVTYSVGHTLTVRAGFGKMSAYVSKVEYEHPEVPQALADAIVG
ncbi:MAG: DUF4330 domain-containing protein [Oscillospiraceae bacterium]|nr:DUF4330 domain-containing protein [Oscillospiraceae bacterium]